MNLNRGENLMIARLQRVLTTIMLAYLSILTLVNIYNGFDKLVYRVSRADIKGILVYSLGPFFWVAMLCLPLIISLILTFLLSVFMGRHGLATPNKLESKVYYYISACILSIGWLLHAPFLFHALKSL